MKCSYCNYESCMWIPFEHDNYNGDWFCPKCNLHTKHEWKHQNGKVIKND